MPKTNAAQAARLFRSLRSRLTQAVIAAETKTLVVAKYELEQATAGTLTPADLRRLDHPYAKRHGEALRDPAITNRKSGELNRSFRRGRVVRVAGGTRGAVTNRAKSVAGIKAGGSPSSAMVKRRLVRRVLKRIQPERTRRVKSAINHVLKGV